MKKKLALKILILLFILSIIPLFTLFKNSIDNSSLNSLKYYAPRLIIPQFLKSPEPLGSCGDKEFPKLGGSSSAGDHLPFWQRVPTPLGGDSSGPPIARTAPPLFPYPSLGEHRLKPRLLWNRAPASGGEAAGTGRRVGTRVLLCRQDNFLLK